MTLESTNNNADRWQLKKTGAHRRRRKHRSALTRTVAVGGAAICIGAAYDLSTPVADALSIVLPGRTVNGVGNTTRINIFEGNIFMPQLGLGGSVSNNSTVGNVAMNYGNDIISQLLNFEINLGGAVANGNTTQVNLFSYNIFNPQFSLGGNVSNNTSIGNVAMNNGNNSSAVTSVGSLFPWLGGPAGNGNTFQFAFFSGNIFNPQYSIGGNVSNNTTVTNAAINNGNYSRTAATSVGVLSSLLGTTGNGNTFQLAFFVSNIFNPQYSFGGGNTSNNSSATNTATNNGNNASTGTTGGGTSVGGTTGNGNTTQVAGGSGNIINDQVNIGVNLLHSTGTASSTQQQSLAADTVGSNNSNSTGAGSVSLLRSTTTASSSGQHSDDLDAVSSNSPISTTSGSQSLSFAPTTKVSDTSAPAGSSTNDTASASHAEGDAGGGAGSGGGVGDGGG
jgi:hypothetical protein